MSSGGDTSGARGRKGSKYQPKSSARRSEAERVEQEEQAEARRQRLVSEATRATNRARERTNVRKTRGGSGFRGGLSGWRNESQATGFLGEALSSAVLIPDSLSNPLPDLATASEPVLVEPSVAQNIPTVKSTRGSKRNKKELASEISAKPKVKEEDGEVEVVAEAEDKDKDDYGDGDMKMVDANVAKQRNGIDIDTLAYNNMISDEEEPYDKDGNLRKALYPVRLKRRPHMERKTTIDTTASSKHAGQIRQEAAARGISVSDIQMTIDDDDSVKFMSIAEEGKQHERPTQNSQQQAITNQIKTEEEEAKPVVSVGRSSTRLRSSKTREYVELSDDDIPQNPASPPKHRRRNQPLFSKPILQTPEDHEEWKRHLEDRKAIAEELGNDDENMLDQSMSNTATSKQRVSRGRRDDKVYLLQLPPVMPDLQPRSDMGLAEQQEEASTAEVRDQTISSHDKGKAPARPQGSTQDIEVKVEEDARGPEPHSSSLSKVPLNASSEFKLKGYVGTLTVYESGATALDWGGIEFQLERGMGSMLQETLLIDGKLANSMSRAAASFIVKPNWDALLEADS